jgi:adenine-specific DNA-methyltransferase
MDNSLIKFQNLLKEIFQFEAADLDFGIYRILNFKRDLINTFINEDLKSRVEAIFTEFQKDDLSKLEQELAEARQAVIENVAADAITPAGSIKEEFQGLKICQEYLKLLNSKKDLSDLENIKKQTFNDLFNFFSRYYSEGDFVPQYRYSIKSNRYAIPYNGEEIKFYWANNDQYYTKTGVFFRDYSFFTDITKEYKVIFRTVEAREELGSNKATKQRFFILNDELPVEILENNTIIVRFHYRELYDKEVKKYKVGGGSMTSKQQKLNEFIAENILKNIKDIKLKGFLTKVHKNGRSLLLHHITRYAAKNARDFFIHKNLKKFLSEQLDYYIKSEVISLETIVEGKNVERHLSRARAVRRIGEDIISFLAQIEDFQKKLWEKKKFVLRTDYVITSDRIPKELQSKILANSKQKEEWKLLGIEPPKSKKDLNDNFYPVDTRHFGLDFKEKLLEKLTEDADLDDLLDGLIIKSENWQALNLLQKKYWEQIDCVHIDPPYNTKTSGFLYKNNYKHSSWITMMHNRVEMAIDFLSDDASFQCHIDENEFDNLFGILKSFQFPYQGTVVWDKRNPMMGGKGIAAQHEYIIWVSNYLGQFLSKSGNIRKILDKSLSIINKNGGVCEKTRKEFSDWIRDQKGLTGGERAYKYIDDDGRVYQSVAMTWPNPNPAPPQFFIPLIHPKTNKPCPVPARGWSRTPEKMKELLDRNEIIFGDDETIQPRRKIYLSNKSNRPLSSVIQSGRKGKAELESIGLSFNYCHPASLYEEIIYGGLLNSKGLVLDFFAGSGTTGHAVMALNREDEGNRKYILVEMANYFETVLISRIKKISYSFNWRDGKPQDNEGISQFFKYQYLEQYEDTLDNIEIVPDGAAQQLLGDDYLLKYFLDFETRESASLLNIEHLKTPFSYRLRVNFDEIGEPEEAAVDIPETFNYLLGLSVKKLKYRKSEGRKYVFILGEKDSRDIAVVWRNYEEDWDKKTFKKDKDFIEENILPWKPQVVYVNGQSVLTPELGETRADVRYIESEFRKLMG